MAPFQEVQLDPFARKVLKDNIFLPVSVVVFGASAATAGNYGQFFVSDRGWQVVSISSTHRVGGTDSGTITISVEKCASGHIADSGVDLLATALSLKPFFAGVPQFGVLTNTKADLIIKRGDRLILKDSGTLTFVADVCVTILLKQL